MAYLLLDGSNNILQAYLGPAAGAPAGSIEVADEIYQQLPTDLSGWKYVAATGSESEGVTPPPGFVPSTVVD